MKHVLVVLCAWILWAEWGGGMVKMPGGGIYNPTRYLVVQAWNERPACEAAALQFKLPEGYKRMICLPDTVKP